MEYLDQFYGRIDELYRDPSLNKYTRFINLMKVVYNMHEFYMKHYSRIMASCKNIIEESENRRTFLHDSYVAIDRIDAEYKELVYELGYREDDARIKNMVKMKITETVNFLEKKLADDFNMN